MSKLKKRKNSDSALNVQKGIDQPSQINEEILKKFKNRKADQLTIDDYLEGITAGNRMVLSKAITLVESSLPAHQIIALFPQKAR